MQKGEHLEPNYVQNFHPFGRLPVLNDGGIRLFESRAICEYLVAKYGPHSPLQRRTEHNYAELATYEQAASVEYSYFDPTMKSLAYEKMFKRFMGRGDPDKATVERLEADLVQVFQHYEKVLSHSDYLAGNSSWYNASSVPHAPFKDLFTDLDDARHATNRRLVANLYSTSTLRSMEPEVEDCIKAYKQKLESLAHSRMNMDLQFWMQCYAFDVISQITLDKRFGFLDSGADRGGMFASLHEYLKYCAVVGVEHEWHETLFWFMSKLPARGLAYVAQFTGEQINQRKQALKVGSLAEKTQKKDFLSKLFHLHDENPERFPDGAIFTTCNTNIGAGSDTTSISLCAIMQNLAESPALRREVDARYEDLGEPDFIPFNETQSMKYLQACIKEALRLHPATGLPLERVVPRGGVALSGTYFPAGTIVGVNTWVMHRNQDVFGVDADTFMPERWLNQSKERLSLMEASWIP
ncbi:cytochrome P450 monooxygenase oxidoreductase, partial [Fusarium pseudocircinatum]